MDGYGYRFDVHICIYIYIYIRTQQHPQKLRLRTHWNVKRAFDMACETMRASRRGKSPRKMKPKGGWFSAEKSSQNAYGYEFLPSLQLTVHP